MRQSSITPPRVLNSWKEIAVFLGRGVRTVQRWEQELRMPVHRVGIGPRPRVYTTVQELRFWLSTSEVVRQQLPPANLQPIGQDKNSVIADSRRLVASVRALARSLAENSVRQRRQAEVLEARLLQIRSRLKGK